MPRSLIRVVLDTTDGEVEHKVRYDGRDIRAYEAEFEESALAGISYTQVCKIGWCAMRRQGLFAGPWESFDEQCIEAEDRLDLPADEADGDVDPERPTQPAPGVGS